MLKKTSAFVIASPIKKKEINGRIGKPTAGTFTVKKSSIPKTVIERLRIYNS